LEFEFGGVAKGREGKLEARREKLERRGMPGFPTNTVGTPTNRGKARRYANSGLGDFAGGFFEEFVDEGLVGLGLLGGHAAELTEQLRGDANGDELFCVSRSGAADSAGAAQFGIGRFGNVGKVELAIRHRLGVPCGSPGAR